MIGSYFRGHQIDKKRIQLYLLLISGFMSGGAIGSFLYKNYGFSALKFPSLLAICLAIIYWLYLFHLYRLKRENR